MHLCRGFTHEWIGEHKPYTDLQLTAPKLGCLVQARQANDDRRSGNEPQLIAADAAIAAACHWPAIMS